MEKTNIVSNEIREEKVPKSHETADFGQEGAAPAARVCAGVWVCGCVCGGGCWVWGAPVYSTPTH